MARKEVSQMTREKLANEDPHSPGANLPEKRGPRAIGLELSADLPPEIKGAFAAGLDVTVPDGAEEIAYVPSFTIPIGATVAGIYGGIRTEETVEETNDKTGEVTPAGQFQAHLFRNLNGTGQDVWLRGGWNFDQLIRMAKIGEKQTVTIMRGLDKQHPKNKAWRIAQFRLWR